MFARSTAQHRFTVLAAALCPAALARSNNLMPRPFQFSLRDLLVTVTAAALGAGVISWLAPQTRFQLAIWIQVFGLLFGTFFTGVLAIAGVLFCYRLCRRAIAQAMIVMRRQNNR